MCEIKLKRNVQSNIDMIHHGVNCGYDPSGLGNEVIDLLEKFNNEKLTPTVYTKSIVIRYEDFAIRITQNEYHIITYLKDDTHLGSIHLDKKQGYTILNYYFQKYLETKYNG